MQNWLHYWSRRGAEESILLFVADFEDQLFIETDEKDDGYRGVAWWYQWIDASTDYYLQRKYRILRVQQTGVQT